MTRLRILAATLGLLSGLVAAQETGLYGPQLPQGAAFVRLVHAAPSLAPFEATVGAIRYAALSYAETSPYRPFSEDVYFVQAAGFEAPMAALADHFYTVAVTDDGLVIITDDVLDDPARALLALCNLSPLDRIDLLTADHRTEVIVDVAPQTCASVAVNAIEVPLAVFGNGGILETVTLQLRRGEAYTLFVLGEAQAVTVSPVQATLAAD